ncbi:MAG: tetratricopeptide repeat protein, partial [Desulfobacterales bacterium]
MKSRRTTRLPDLYKYGRESAYLAGHMNQALGFASDLADLLGDMAPETKDHAEALLRLGLMHAKKDNYEQAVPIIEQAVAIMSTLPPDEDLVRAVMELGIVLENATSYDTALSRFKAAADLSRTLNQDELLAAQHLNIGRVYDLRLNQYAAAIQSYEKALEIYTASGDVEKIAESRLNIGRCWRLLGNFAEADRCYEESLALIAEKAPDLSMMKAKILIEKANNAWFQGRYEEAFSYQRQCHAISEQED